MTDRFEPPLPALRHTTRHDLPRTSNREDEPQRFRTAYSGILYDYFDRLNGGMFRSHQQATNSILDDIVRVSQAFQDVSNNLAAAMLVILDFKDEFVSLHGLSRNLLQAPSELKDHLNDSLLRLVKSGKNDVLNWVSLLEAPIPLFINFQTRGDTQGTAYRRERTVFVKIDRHAYVSPHLRNFLLAAKGFHARDSATPISDTLLVIPVESFRSSRKSAAALFFGFLAENPEISLDHAWARSLIELEMISLATLPLADVEAEYEIQRQHERARILEGTRQFTNLFVHSFGQCARRIDRASNRLKDGACAGERVEIVDELKSVSRDLKSIKGRVLTPLSDIQWDRTGLLSQALEAAQKKVSSSIEETGIRIDFEANRARRLVVGIDTVILEKILENLLENAVKALVHSDQLNPRILIEIQVDRKRQMVQVAISDNGIGLPKGFSDWIFKTKGRSGWQKGESSGVGLFSCHALLQMFGGSIDIDHSDAEGMKTTAAVSLRLL